MNTWAPRLLAVSTFIFLGSCVSTSTGPERPEPDDEQAAIQYYQLGNRYYRNGNYQFARDRFVRSLEYDPKMAMSHSMLAMTYVELENPRLAKEHFNKSVKYGPDNFDVRNAYAVYLCQRREFGAAREQFDKGIAIYDNDNAEVMMTNAGVCMTNKPDYAVAEQYFREALEFKSSYGEALLQLSIMKFETEDHLRARAFLQRYLSFNPSSAEVLYLAIQIEEALDDDRAATDYTNQLLRDYPNSAEARRVLRSG